MITPKFNPELKTPIYIQLYGIIKNEILSGKIKPGEKLPSKRNLAAHGGISVNTCSLAYEMLIDEGYITSKERSGFFVEDTGLLTKTKVINIEKSSGNHSLSSYREEACSNIKYDFSYNVIDKEIFPYGIFKKLSKELFNPCAEDLLSIGDKRGSLKLREAIAMYLQENRGFSCSLDNIIISSGTEYLFQILFGILNPDSTFAIENPGYEKWCNLFESNRIKYIPIPVSSLGMSLETLSQSYCNIACITPSHQFPTGIVMPISERFKILSWANRSSERYIVEDDYDSEFKYLGAPIPSLKSLDVNDRVIYIGNFSKSIAPSLRVSYMVLPNILLEKYLSIPHMICPVSGFMQNLLAAFINQGYFEKHLNRSRNLYKKKRKLITSLIEKKLPDCKIVGSQAGLHFILDTGLSRDAEKSIVKTANKNGISLSHISDYYIPENDPNVREPKGILLGFGGIKFDLISEGIIELSVLINSFREK